MRVKVKKLVENPLFQNIILGVIIFNAITLGIDTWRDAPVVLSKSLKIIDSIVIIIFTIEIILKLYAYGFKFFKNGFNIFDFIIVSVSYLPVGTGMSAMRVFRILRTIRVLRILRIVTSLKRLRIIVVAIIETLPSMGWVSVLLFVVYYIFAIIGTNLFGAAFDEWFGTLGRSMYTLFQVMTLESWSMGISRPIMQVFPYAFLYFIPFIVVSAFIVLNVVVGIVVNAISEISAAEAKDKEEAIEGSASSKTEEIKSELVKLKAQIENLEKLL